LFHREILGMSIMLLFEICLLNLRSNQSELGKSPCNMDKIRVVLPVKWLISNYRKKERMTNWTWMIDLQQLSLSRLYFNFVRCLNRCFWQDSDSVCTTVLTVTLSKKKNLASRGFLTLSGKKEPRFARFVGWTVYWKNRA